MRAHWNRINDWLDHRTGVHTAVRKFLYEDIPASSGWHQVFGSVALFLFLVQSFSGALLAFNYAPTPGDAYNSLRYILTELTGGRLMRGLHHWGASLMITVVVLHIIQVFLFGAYKKPREATWMVGVVLLLLTLAYGLTGYLLPWDNRAYWGTVVATNIASQAPLLGQYLSRLLGGQVFRIAVVVDQQVVVLVFFPLGRPGADHAARGDVEARAEMEGINHTVSVSTSAAGWERDCVTVEFLCTHVLTPCRSDYSKTAMSRRSPPCSRRGQARDP